MSTFGWLDALGQDVRYTARTLHKNPGFAVATVLILALGIGAGTAIFSVVNTVLLRPLPYNDAGHIYRLRTIDPQGLPFGTLGRIHIDPLNEEGGSVLAAAYGFSAESSILGRDGLGFATNEYRVSERFFQVFTDPLTIGRGFQPGDATDNTVLSHRVWRDVFQSDPEILGSVVIVNATPRTIIGVAAPEFEFPAGTGAWTAAYTGAGSRILTNMDGYARLKPGFSAEQYQAQLDVLASQLGPWADGHPLQFVSKPLIEDVVGDFRSTILLLLGAAGILLLIACLNVGILLFTRGSVRAREIAVRRALGAGRWRVVRQLMTETCALSVLGGALGLGVAAAAVRISSAIGFAGLPRLENLSIDRNVFLFAAACILVTTLVVGVAPALRKARGDLTGLINDGGRSVSHGRPRNRLFATLVVAEVALAVTLVIGAGLLVRNYVHVASIDPGFNPDRLLTVLLNVSGRVDLQAQTANGQNSPAGGQATGYLPVARFYQELMDRIRVMPGVESVAATSHVPLNPGVFPVARAPFLVSGEQFNPQANRQAQTSQISPEYFESMGVRPIDGRLFQPSDRREAPGVVLVNEAFVRSVYTDGKAVGQSLNFPGARGWSPRGPVFQLGEMTTGTFQIVGVVPDIRQSTLWEEPRPTIYFPQEQFTIRRMAVVVRTQFENPSSLIPAIRRSLAEMDPTIPAVVSVFSDVLSAAVARQRLGMALLTAFGLASLTLAAIGIYGLMSYSVTQRSPEIALRSALGARANQLLGMIVASTLRLAAIGIALGLAGAWAMRTIVASQLYQIDSLDPLVFATVPATMLVVLLLSSWLPARRATSIDPATTLRPQ